MTYPRMLGPEALAEFYGIFDDVWDQLVEDGIETTFRTDDVRTCLANKVLALTLPSRWSDIQIKQLLTRAIRNEVAWQSRPKRPQSPVGIRAN
jgi:hypothetical protein